MSVLSVLPQIAPARAQQVIQTEEDLERFKNGFYFAEEKIDGARYKLHTFKDGNRIDSRRESVTDGLFVEKTDNVPHIRDMELPPGWVVDTEIIARHGLTSHDKCANTVSIMGSLPERALAVQEEHGYAVMYAFDVLFADGNDVRHLPLKTRLGLLTQFMEYANLRHIRRMPAWWNPAQFQSAFDQVTKEEKGEGLIVKDLELPYGHPKAWFKYKRFFDIDVVATGVTPGKGKYKDSIGAIKFGLFNNGRLHEVGQCSGMTDAVREAIARGHPVGSVFEVRGWDITKDNKIRNANFRRWRPDKNAAECTFDSQLVPNSRR